MFDRIPEAFHDLFSDKVRAIAALATIMEDGSPQVTPVWFDVEDDFIRINTARGRVKDRNMTARPRVALSISDPGNPYRYIQIRGTVESSNEEGAREHIDRLAQKYLSIKEYPWYGGETRVIYRIRPYAASSME
jgi:PPOX class probable F420-dependent enzyme